MKIGLIDGYRIFRISHSRFILSIFYFLIYYLCDLAFNETLRYISQNSKKNLTGENFVNIFETKFIEIFIIIILN